MKTKITAKMINEALKMNEAFNTAKNVDFEAYSNELTQTLIDTVLYDEAIDCMKEALFIRVLNNKERNTLIRSASNSVLKRSNLDTKSACCDSALTEYRSYHEHVRFINEQSYMITNKKTTKEELFTCDIAYLKRHVTHLTRDLKHLFQIEELETNTTKFKVIKKDQFAKR